MCSWRYFFIYKLNSKSLVQFTPLAWILEAWIYEGSSNFKKINFKWHKRKTSKNQKKMLQAELLLGSGSFFNPLETVRILQWHHLMEDYGVAGKSTSIYSDLSAAISPKQHPDILHLFILFLHPPPSSRQSWGLNPGATTLASIPIPLKTFFFFLYWERVLLHHQGWAPTYETASAS